MGEYGQLVAGVVCIFITDGQRPKGRYAGAWNTAVECVKAVRRFPRRRQKIQAAGVANEVDTVAHFSP